MNALINSRMRRAGTSPFVVFLLSGILLTLVALVLVIVLRPGSEGAAPGKPKRESVKDKAIKTRGDLEREGSSPAKPSGTVDKSRIVQTYRQGYTYRSLLKIALTARASSKDWGIVNDTTLHYLAEAELLRMIESNDGTTVMLVQEFRRARTLSIWSKIEGIRLELGLPAHLLLEAGGTFYEIGRAHV